MYISCFPPQRFVLSLSKVKIWHLRNRISATLEVAWASFSMSSASFACRFQARHQSSSIPRPLLHLSYCPSSVYAGWHAILW